MKKIILTIPVLSLILSCDNSPNSSKIPLDDSSKIQVQADTTKVLPQANWEYSQDTDKMTSHVSYYAQSISNNEIDFKPPYDGGSKFNLTVRKRNGENEVMLQVDKGQFMPNIADERMIKVKFDDGQPNEYSYNEASDGSSNIIFIESCQSLIKKLKTSKKLMIEAEFYEEGRKVIEFDVSGFEWKH